MECCSRLGGTGKSKDGCPAGRGALDDLRDQLTWPPAYGSPRCLLTSQCGDKRQRPASSAVQASKRAKQPNAKANPTRCPCPRRPMGAQSPRRRPSSSK
ncbi:hypothetical protein BO71DRAFT_205296 [Aspergillus ellipticus CBS 707.79]|uniref:Uncharacterized protein n=1 Tax=Aspergillus ellipticus CBS 707.79 TaxID=1448320 RepID=A0A319EVB3_9EURO|nr:hypothetical protein BO71DRAFT_205296 [Aspergillus ellipticus CBS 707.79]